MFIIIETDKQKVGVSSLIVQINEFSIDEQLYTCSFNVCYPSYCFKAEFSTNFLRKDLLNLSEYIKKYQVDDEPYILFDEAEDLTLIAGWYKRCLWLKFFIVWDTKIPFVFAKNPLVDPNEQSYIGYSSKCPSFDSGCFVFSLWEFDLIGARIERYCRPETLLF